MTTMIQSDDPTMYVGMIGDAIWADAVEDIMDGVVPAGDPDKLAFWEAAGIIADGELDHNWGRALEIARTSTRGVEIVSRYDGVIFSATVLLANERDHATCITNRATVEADAQGVEVVGAVNPMAEVAIAPAHRLWQLIRRVLPPIAHLRHEPRATSLAEAERVTLDGVAIPDAMRATPSNFATHLFELPNLPKAFIDMADPEATVFTYTLVSDEGGVRTFSRTWAIGDHLYFIDADTASVWRVPPGNLGHALVQGLTG